MQRHFKEVIDFLIVSLLRLGEHCILAVLAACFLGSDHRKIRQALPGFEKVQIKPFSTV